MPVRILDIAGLAADVVLGVGDVSRLAILPHPFIETWRTAGVEGPTRTSCSVFFYSAVSPMPADA